MNSINKNLELAQKIQTDITNQSFLNEKFKSDWSKQVIQNLLSKPTDLSTDWEDWTLEYPETFEYNPDNQNFNVQYKKWIFEFAMFDIRLLMFFNHQILYRKKGGEISYLTAYESKNFLIEDIKELDPPSEYYKRVTMEISGYFNSSDVTTPLQFKLVLLFQPPRKIIT